MRLPSFASFLFLILLTGCTFVQQRYPTLPPGPYRGIIELEYNPIVPNPKGAPIPEKTDLEFDEVLEGQLPFTFDVVYENDSAFHFAIHNGEETIIVPPENIQAGWNQSQGRDTLRIEFPAFDTHISAYHEENVIEGVWVVHYRENYRIPFKAYFGKNHRFTTLRKQPAADLTGRWEATFAINSDEPYPAIAEFEQSGNELTGTFRTQTGDYRYLAGTVQGNKAYLSTFDGSHAYLFEALIKPDGTLSGTFRSGRHYISEWAAKRNDQVQLANPESLTSVINDEPIAFDFPASDGQLVSYNDPQFDGKPKLILIMGTWCPNSRDAVEFLKQYLGEHEIGDLQIIALAFEKYDDPERNLEVIRRYENVVQSSWPILLAGKANKDEASRVFPMLSGIKSFPTLLFVDENDRIQHVYTGFNGPATSEFENFSRSFDEMVKELVSPLE